MQQRGSHIGLGCNMSEGGGTTEGSPSGCQKKKKKGRREKVKSIISMKVRKKKYSDLSEGLKKVETYRREWQ